MSEDHSDLKAMNDELRLSFAAGVNATFAQRKKAIRTSQQQRMMIPLRPVLFPHHRRSYHKGV